MNEKKATNAFPRKRNKMKERTRKLTRTEDVWTCISAPLPELDLKAVPGAGCRGILRVLVAPWMLHSLVGASKAADRRASTQRRAENQWENQDRSYKNRE